MSSSICIPDFILFACTLANGCFQQLEVVIVDDDGELQNSTDLFGVMDCSHHLN